MAAVSGNYYIIIIFLFASSSDATVSPPPLLSGFAMTRLIGSLRGLPPYTLTIEGAEDGIKGSLAKNILLSHLPVYILIGVIRGLIGPLYTRVKVKGEIVILVGRGDTDVVGRLTLSLPHFFFSSPGDDLVTFLFG